MMEQIVEKNLDILKKIRLLNIEINKILSNDLNGVKDLYMSKKKILLKKKDEINKSINDIKMKIEGEKISIIKELNHNFDLIDIDIDNEILFETLESSLVNEKDEDKKEILQLKINLAKKNISEYNESLNFKYKELEEQDMLLKNLVSSFRIYEDGNLSNADPAAGNVIELYKSVNYMKDLLNNDVLEKYNLISSNFEDGLYRYPVAAIVDNFCENCNILVPVQKKLDILEMKDFVMCEVCGCFFVDVIE